MKEIALVGLGGFAGSVLRYKVGAMILPLAPTAKFPWATLIVNGSGCLLIGIMAALIERSTSYNAELRLLLITGFLGGFTTFSAFGFETMALLRTGSLNFGLINILSNLVLGILMVWVGMCISSYLR